MAIQSSVLSSHLGESLEHLHQLLLAPYKGANPDCDAAILPFEAAQSASRPHEYLQCMLDVLRVTFEPAPIGSVLLNANPNLFTSIPALMGAFDLGYGSLVADPAQAFGDFWPQTMKPHLRSHGSDPDAAQAVFVIVTTGPERYGPALLDEIAPALEDQAHYGFCLDPALEGRLRVSVWCVSPARAPS
ncbi:MULTISPECIES: hypothetical protein [unclassified Thioalkalivibrio]|uniref:hypothetical protein n=1 Tax=unclassified Thioalkalivibrio TaxID=2621013 RepID=UPI00036A4A1D|nr:MULTISPECIES: hypothetical protein [unclassified Thioalkalivibrio]